MIKFFYIAIFSVFSSQTAFAGSNICDYDPGQTTGVKVRHNLSQWNRGRSNRGVHEHNMNNEFYHLNIKLPADCQLSNVKVRHTLTSRKYVEGFGVFSKSADRVSCLENLKQVVSETLKKRYAFDPEYSEINPCPLQLLEISDVESTINLDNESLLKSAVQ